MIGRLDRRGLARFLESLQLTPPLELDRFVERLAASRGRELRLLPHPICVPGPSGCWIATPTTDYIVYQRETTTAHQTHIILHEIGHIIAGHDRPTLADPDGTGPRETVDGTPPDLAAVERDAVDSVLYRTSYSAAREREAERIATILTAWSATGTARPTDETTVLLGRLEASLIGVHWR